jgi:hypothetical protein
MRLRAGSGSGFIEICLMVYKTVNVAAEKASLLCVPIGPELGYDGLRGKLFPKNQSIPDVVYQSLS